MKLILIISCLIYNFIICFSHESSENNSQRAVYYLRPVQKECKNNLTFTSCSMERCNGNCEDENPFNKICPRICIRVNDCECLKPFVKDQNNNCIKYEDCPPRQPQTTTVEPTKPKCPPNMKYLKCYSKYMPKCSDKTHSKHLCTLCRKYKRCVCQYPYALDNEGNCILHTDCPKKTTIPPMMTTSETCPDNYTLSYCKPKYVPKCSNDDPFKNICYQCKKYKTCVCKKPYVMTSDNHCILYSECPPLICPPNTVPTKCYSSCDATCKNPTPTGKKCKEKCSKDKVCKCMPPNVLDGNGNCIEAVQCPQ